MNHILYGVGQSILRDFMDESKVIGMTKLQNVTISGTGSETDVFAGDNPFPWTSFPTDKAITVTAQSANFSLKQLNITQGASVTTGTAVFTEVVEVLIPADGQIALDHEAIAGSVVVDGFTEASDLATISAGQYFLDTTDGKLLHFAPDDAGQEVEIVYEWNTEATAETLSVLKDTFAKPFKFIHRIPIYDDNSQIVAQGQLTVYKAKANNSFEFNLQRQTAYAPSLELRALDPKRADKKLWDFTIAPV